MKKTAIVLSFILSLITLFTAVGCNNTPTPSTEQGAMPTSVKIIMPDGAPALSLSYLYQNATKKEDGGATVLTETGFLGEGVTTTYSLAAETALASSMAAKKADIALMPTNAAATIFNKGADVKILTVNVHGLLYMLGNAPVADLNELKGKVVYSIGEGGTPDYVFKYVLDAAGIAYEKGVEPVADKVVISYVEGGPALIPLLKTGKAEYGIIGEPAATNATKATGKVVALDLQQEWKKATLKVEGAEYALPQASVVISGELAKNYPAFVTAFLAKLQEANAWLPQNIAAAQTAMQNLGSTTAQSTTFTAELIARCNLNAVPVCEIRSDVNAYFNALYTFKPATVGGKLPAEDLFYRN